LGYLVAPADLIARFEAVKSITSRHAQLMDQAVLCDFIIEGHFARHLRRMREIYAERLSVLLDAVKKRLAGVMEISDVEAGLQTAAWLRPGIDACAVERSAKARGVHVTAISRFACRPLAKDGLQLGFAAIGPEEIRRGVDELASVIEPLARD
jgi:GntR family transcriptional regulator/MocR family aminotransferase